MSNHSAPPGPDGVFQAVPELLCVATRDGVVRTVNRACHRVLGFAPEELEGRAVAEFVVEEDASGARSLFRDLDAGGPTASRVLRFTSPDGRLRRVRWDVRLQEETGLRYAVAWDVTEKQHREARYRASAEASPTALIMVDPRGRIALANKAAHDLLGYDGSSLLSERIESLVPEDIRARHPRLRRDFLRNPTERPMGKGRDLFVQAADGRMISVEIGLNPVDVDGEVHTVVSLVDLTERNRASQDIRALADELRKANEKLQEISITDSLTGLGNRRWFFEEGERLLRLLQQTGGPFSVLLADVDDFKAVNDDFGHLVGDRVLVRVGDIMAEVRSGSDLSARYGGEEFVVGLPGCGREEALALAERLRAAVEAHADEPAITVSVGVASREALGDRGTPPGPILERLIADADAALYRAKKAGKNRVVHADGWGEPPEAAALEG